MDAQNMSVSGPVSEQERLCGIAIKYCFYPLPTCAYEVFFLAKFERYCKLYLILRKQQLKPLISSLSTRLCPCK